MAEFNFVHNTTEFNLQNAYSLAMASELAYRKQKYIEKTVIDEWNLQDFHFFNVEGLQGFSMSNSEIIVVAFRGTESDQIKDWVNNLDLDLVDGPLEGKVHSGFYTSLVKVWNEIKETITQQRANKPKSLWFTGHSLGGALATLAAAQLYNEDYPVDGLYTFGQPRTGDQTFARNFDLEFKPYAFRFVNNNDTVTRIPPRLLKYSHVGVLKYFTESGQLVDDIGYWNRFLDRIKGRIEDFLEWGTDGIKDHSMAEYKRLIKEALQAE